MDEETEKQLLARLRAESQALEARLGALIASEYPESFRPKQLPPDHPDHHQPDRKGYVCGCQGNDDSFVIWLVMSG